MKKELENNDLRVESDGGREMTVHPKTQPALVVSLKVENDNFVIEVSDQDASIFTRPRPVIVRGPHHDG